MIILMLNSYQCNCFELFLMYADNSMYQFSDAIEVILKLPVLFAYKQKFVFILQATCYKTSHRSLISYNNCRHVSVVIGKATKEQTERMTLMAIIIFQSISMSLAFLSHKLLKDSRRKWKKAIKLSRKNLTRKKVDHSKKGIINPWIIFVRQ